MIRPANPMGLGPVVPTLVPMGTIPAVERYLHALAGVCLEVAREPRLLPVFLRIVMMVPATVRELRGDARVAA